MVSCVESRGINLSGSLKRGNFYKIHILISYYTYTDLFVIRLITTFCGTGTIFAKSSITIKNRSISSTSTEIT